MTTKANDKKVIAGKVSRTESNRIQRSLRNKVTDTMLDMELDRFVEMDVNKLSSRINRFKNPVKAEACRQMAKQVGLSRIWKLARYKRNELFLIAEKS